MKTKPKINIDLKRVEQYAAQGMTRQQIAESLDISSSTLYNRIRDSEEFVKALKKGEGMGVAVATNKLFQLVKSGNLGAICFFLKCKGGWKETSAVEMSSPDGSMSPQPVVIDISTMSPKEVAKMARAAFKGEAGK